MKLASEDLGFLRSLRHSLIALAASAFVLLGSSVVYLDRYNPEATISAGSQTIKGSQFQTLMGTTELHGETLVLKSLQSEGGQQHALISKHIGLAAEHYPLLRYRLEGFPSGLQVQLFWRTAETADRKLSASIAGGIGGTTYANLSAHPDWRGTVTDVALYFTGDLRDQNLTIPEISFEPYSWQGLISAIFFEWTGFRGWKGRSINILWGTLDAPQSQTVSPTLAIAAWAGLALVFLFGIGIVQGKKSLISYGAVVLIPWIALDQLWQSELSTQLQETKRIFHGATMHQKHLADDDSYIYSYTKRLKEQVLPASDARIIILHGSSGHNYLRLKTQYYLLPHNIYNFGVLPPSLGIHPGDYILALGNIPELRYNRSQELIAWEPEHRIRARLIDTDEMGLLFHVMPPVSGATDASERTRQD